MYIVTFKDGIVCLQLIYLEDGKDKLAFEAEQTCTHLVQEHSLLNVM